MDVEYRGPFITSDFDSIKNLHANFSEDEVYLKALLNGDYSDTLSFALGTWHLALNILGITWGQAGMMIPMRCYSEMVETL